MTPFKSAIGSPVIVKRQAFLCLLLALVTLVAYRPVLTAQFLVYDDPDYVTANPHVLTGVTVQNLQWALFTGHADNWHPLTWVSHMLDCQFFGTNAPAHHLVNVLIHIANSVLLFLLLGRMTGAKWRSALVAGLFALHPLHVQSVAWVAERKDVLSTLFWLLTLWSYTRYAAHGRKLRYCATLLAFALGLMAKPMLVTLPCVLLLLDYWPLARFAKAGKTSLVVEKIPFFILSAAVSVITIAAQKKQALVSLHVFPFTLRLENAVTACAAYLGKTFCPARLAVIYPYNMHPAPLQVIAALAALLFISGYAIVFAKSRPYLLMGWLWFLGTLVPVIGIIQVGAQSMADRYTYIPSIGLFIMIVWGCADACGFLKIPAFARATCAFLVLAACVFITRIQLSYWHDSIALFGHAIECTGDNAIAQDLLGKALSDQQRHAEAIGHYTAALQIDPKDSKTWNNAGISLLTIGKREEAVHAWMQALALNPYFEEAYSNLAVALGQAGKTGEMELERLKYLGPVGANTHYNLGNLAMNSGRLDEAASHYSEAIRLNPGFTDARASLAITLLAAGKTPEAILQYKTWMQLNPDDIQAMTGLAWIFATNSNATFRDEGEAVRLAERACAITQSHDAGSLDVLAAAYANARRFPDALRMDSLALELAKTSGQDRLASGIQERITLYRSGKPYRAVTAGMLQKPG